MNTLLSFALNSSMSLANPDTDDKIQPAIDNQPALTVLYSGNLKGVSSERYPFPSIAQIQKGENNGQLKSMDFQQGHIAELDGWLLQVPELGLKEGIKQLKSKSLRCKSGEPISAIENPYEILLADPRGQDGLQDLLSETDSKVVQWSVALCTDQDGKTLSLIKRGRSQTMPSLTDSVIELRKSYRTQLDFGKGAFDVVSIGKPSQEFSRLYNHTKELIQRDAHIFVDAGNFVDGASSIVPHETSLHRPMAYQALANLNPSALGFGQNELIGGFQNFLSEIQPHALPYIASNWTSEKPELAFPTHRLVQFEIENANVEVAFLSIMDPKIHQLVPRLSEEGVQITEPVQAAQNIVDALNSSPNPPKLIVILTTADAETQEAIRRKLKGAHLMIGDSTMATLRIEERLTDFVNMGAHNKAAPLTIPMDGLAEIEITFEIGHLKRLRNRPIHITSEMPTDSLITANITQNRLDHYDEESHFLLMPEGTGSLSQFDHTQWSQTVCEALRVHTGADTVFLRELPEITPIPGPIRQKDISDALSLMDTVEQHRIQGSKFARFLDQSVGITPVICGAQPGATYPVAKGRRIDTDQMYVVVTTDLTRLGSTLDQTINAHVKNHTLDPPSQRTLSTPEGQPLSLREAVITELRNTNSRLGTEKVYPYLSTISPVDKPPLWIFRSRGLSYRNERFQGMETDTFSAVPETLATSPSSSTLGYVADLALEYSDSNVIGDLRYQSRFTELTADEVNTEIEDDWKLSTSITRPSWGVETGGILWMPYSELLYDSEYTPIEDDNGVSSPNRQSDLSVRAGLSTRPWKFIRNVRLAGLANRDIALLEDKPTEYAALAQFEMKVALRGGLIWSSNGEYLWYGKTQDDDLSDLRVRASGTSQISYPFSRLGSISVYGDALLIKGRLEDTSEWGFAYTTGLSIDLIGAITLNQK